MSEEAKPISWKMKLFLFFFFGFSAFGITGLVQEWNSVVEHARSPEQKALAVEKAREKKIWALFDSSKSAPKLVSYVKKNMNNPDSFSHKETFYWDKNTYIIVSMDYFKNDMPMKIKAKISLDGELMEILEVK